MTIIINGSATDTSKATVLYQNILAEYPLSVSSQAAGFSATNLLDDATWNGWQPITVPATITIDAVTPITCDACGMSSHDLALNGAALQVQHSDDAITWTTAIFYDPLVDDTMIGLFAPRTARYWRIRVTGAVATIGAIFVGIKLAFPCAPLSGYKPLHHSKRIDQMVNRSIGGQLLGNKIVRQGAMTTVDMGQLDRAFVENTMAVFEAHYNDGRAFFYAASPLDVARDVGYCTRPSGGDVMSVTLTEGDALASVAFEVEAYGA